MSKIEEVTLKKGVNVIKARVQTILSLGFDEESKSIKAQILTTEDSNFPEEVELFLITLGEVPGNHAHLASITNPDTKERIHIFRKLPPPPPKNIITPGQG